MNDELDIRIRPVKCYDCSKNFERTAVKRMQGGDILLCDPCRHHRNRRRARAKKVKLRKRKIA